MKKLTFCIALLLLLATLAACSRRGKYEAQYESMLAAESESRAAAGNQDSTDDRGDGDGDVIRPDPPSVEDGETAPPYTGEVPSNRGYRLEHIIKDGDTGYYEGKTLDELAAMFTPNGGDAFHSFSPYTIVTPTGAFVMDNANGNRCYFNKMTGNSAPFCPDPLCNPSECLLESGACPDFLYIGANHFYFEHQGYIYRCDSNRLHLEQLMKTDIIISSSEWETFEDGSGIGSVQGQSGFETIIYAEGDTLYMTILVYREDDVGVKTYGKFDCVSKTFTPLPGAEGLTVAGVSNGDTVWSYLENSAGKVEFYRSDLDFTHVERVTALEEALVEDYLYAGYNEFFGDYVYTVAYSESETQYLLYNYKTGTFSDALGDWMNSCRNQIFSGKYVYYTRDMTEEEVAAHPLQEFFHYDEIIQYENFWDGSWSTGHGTCLNTEGGRVWRRDLETGEEELVLELTYNDVPVWIWDIEMDGNVCYVTYANYENFNNYYNKTQFLRESPETFSCAVADLSNGTLRLVEFFEDD